jgi:hypothetical protein
MMVHFLGSSSGATRHGLGELVVDKDVLYFRYHDAPTFLSLIAIKNSVSGVQGGV